MRYITKIHRYGHNVAGLMELLFNNKPDAVLEDIMSWNEKQDEAWNGRKQMVESTRAKDPSSGGPPRPNGNDDTTQSMDIDTARSETRRCYNCNREGHLARNCRSEGGGAYKKAKGR